MLSHQIDGDLRTYTKVAKRPGKHIRRGSDGNVVGGVLCRPTTAAGTPEGETPSILVVQHFPIFGMRADSAEHIPNPLALTRPVQYTLTIVVSVASYGVGQARVLPQETPLHCSSMGWIFRDHIHPNVGETTPALFLPSRILAA